MGRCSGEPDEINFFAFLYEESVRRGNAFYVDSGDTVLGRLGTKQLSPSMLQELPSMKLCVSEIMVGQTFEGNEPVQLFL